MKARVNNIMATADKSILKDVIDKMPIFNDYTFDSEIGFAACALLDAKVRAASNIGIILSYEYDSIVKQNLLNLVKINEVYNKLNKSDYIKTIKSGGSYSLIEEPVPELFEDTKKDDIISNSAVELFGDIVEID